MKFIFFVMIICSLLGGCSLGLENKIYNNLSEIVDFVVCGDSDAMSVSFMCGRREVEYKINGYSTELIPYGVLCVSLKNDDENIGNVDYKTVQTMGKRMAGGDRGGWTAVSENRAVPSRVNQPDSNPVPRERIIQKA